jgi:putative oxidoreductase
MWNPLRALARPMLASMFIAGGIDALQDPESKADAAEPVVDELTGRLPDDLPEQAQWVEQLDTPQFVRANGAVQVVAGLALALGKAPRLAATALAATLVPTTLAGHRFWEEDDPGAEAAQRVQFLKNVSMLGGLVIAALDTEGEPSVAWRTRHGAEHAALAAKHAKREAELKAEAATERARRATADVRHGADKVALRASSAAKHQADTLGTRAELAKKKLTPDITDAKRLVSALRN